MAHAIARRSGWTIGSDEPQPGDTIPFPPALTTSPRGPEHHAWSDDLGLYVDDEPDLDVVEITQDPPNTPAVCAFCNPPESIAERGTINPDYRLVAPEGVTVAFTCHGCIADCDEVQRTSKRSEDSENPTDADIVD